MLTSEYQIIAFEPKHKPQIVSVWEKSVLATHDFLSEADFHEIKSFVEKMDFLEFEIYCLTKHNKVIGFIGLHAQKIEMLFLSPVYFGKGLGKALIQYGIETLKANAVDVNEQNERAVKFYEAIGFETYERSATDDMGKNYPTLRMRLKP